MAALVDNFVARDVELVFVEFSVSEKRDNEPWLYNADR
jgi:hypothetical protein